MCKRIKTVHILPSTFHSSLCYHHPLPFFAVFPICPLGIQAVLTMTSASITMRSIFVFLYFQAWFYKNSSRIPPCTACVSRLWPMSYNTKQEEHSVTYTFLHLLFWVFPSEFPVSSSGRAPARCCAMSSGKEPMLLTSAQLKYLSGIFVLLVATWPFNNTMG